MIGTDPGLSFYRELSSRAAREALAAGPATIKERCSSSAAYWCAIADAIESGNEVRAAALTRNVTVFRRNL